MIGIINIGHLSGGQNGWHRYQVQVNEKVICKFTHWRDAGLAVCLERAARAVMESEWKDVDKTTCTNK